MKKRGPDSTLSALVGWTGNGSLADLRRTASNVLRANNVSNEGLVTIGGSIAIQGISSLSAAWSLRYLPGVEWIALGKFTGPNTRGVTNSLASVARNYLEKGSTFRVLVEVPGESAKESDLAGAATSRLLEQFRGTKVDDRKPRVHFRIAVDSSSAVVGVEIHRGVGGVPTSLQRTAICLVSGGMHSSVVAWMAARAGYTVSLLHVRENEESMREVAELYAELSRRIDPGALKLNVLIPDEPSNLSGVILARLRRVRSPVTFSGVHAECEGTSFLTSAGVAAPLFLLSEEEFKEVHRSLGLGGYPGRLSLLQPRRAMSDKFRVRSLGGVRADAHQVLDTLFS